MIDGNTQLIAHLGYPTASFRAPMIYNPWFVRHGINAVVVPMGVKAEDFRQSFDSIFRFSNIHGALITMPHKVAVTELLDELSTTARIAGACNAVLKRADGKLIGDQFDGAGFVRGVLRKGFELAGKRVLVLGCGGVGSPIAASLAAAGVAEIMLFDLDTASCEALAGRLREHYPALRVGTSGRDPAGYDLICNATPLGMREGDPLPFDVDRIAPTTFVGEVVMKKEITPLLDQVRAKGCPFQVGSDMLFEMIPAYLEFFGYPTATPEELRAVAQLKY